MVGAVGLAGVAERSAYINNSRKACTVLYPLRELTQYYGGFHYLFGAARRVKKRQASVRVKAEAHYCMGATMLICNEP